MGKAISLKNGDKENEGQEIRGSLLFGRREERRGRHGELGEIYLSFERMKNRGGIVGIGEWLRRGGMSVEDGAASRENNTGRLRLVTKRLRTGDGWQRS